LLQTARPTNEFSGRVQGTFGNYRDMEVDGFVNVPLIRDVLLLRVAFEKQVRDGYSHILAEPGHPNGIYADNRNQYAVRTSLSFRPNDRIQNDTIASWAEYHQYGAAEGANNIPGSAAGAIYPTLAALQAQQQALGTRTFLPTSIDDISNGSLLSASNTTRIRLNDQLTFRNILGVESLYQEIQIDQDGTILPLFDFPAPPPPATRVPPFIGPQQFTEEAQLLGKGFGGRLDWILGGFFLSDPKWGHGGRNFVAIVFGGPTTQSINSFGEWSRAAFAQATYNLTPKVKLTGGLRNTRDTVRSTSLGGLPTSVCAGPNPVDCGPSTETRFEAKSSALTWTLGLDYQATPDTLLYLASRRGYKEGGFNPPQFGFILPDYTPEYVTDLELGIKSDWKIAGVPLRTNADVWYQNYTNIQLGANVPEPITPQNPGGYIFYTINAGKARFYGAEFETQAILTRNLQVGVNFDFMRRDYTEFNTGVPINTIFTLNSQTTLGSPKEKYGVNARYRLPLAENIGGVSVKAMWTWQSYMGDTQVPMGWGGAPAYGLLNMVADWKGMFGSSLDLSVFGSNLLDKGYLLDPTPYWQPGFFGGVGIYGEPRMYGVRLQYRFGGGVK